MISPTHNSPNSAIGRYEAAIVAIEQADGHLSAAQILEVLAARELVRQVLSRKPLTLKEWWADIRAGLLQRKPATPRRRFFRHMNHLDARLEAQSEAIQQIVQLKNWQRLLQPPEQRWAQVVDPAAEIPFRDRFDWLWRGLALAFLTVSLSLLTDLSMRFFEGGPDAIGAFTIIVPSVMGLLAGGGVLTQTGRLAIENILTSLNIARHWWDELLAFSSFSLLVSLIIFWTLLPQVARLYEIRADFAYQQGRLTSAEAGYSRALKLSPGLLDLHYKLGRVYEDWRDVDKALTSYQIAVKGARDGEAYKAHDRLARLYILQGGANNTSRAVSLVNEGLALAETRNDRDVLYASHKNLGWARLQQERYTESVISLERAIRLFPERAAAYCLLAQAQDGLKNTPAALANWEQCLRYANQKDPDEDYWIGLALKRLQADRDKQRKSS